jgi:hypothetical protein
MQSSELDAGYALPETAGISTSTGVITPNNTGTK